MDDSERWSNDQFVVHDDPHYIRAQHDDRDNNWGHEAWQDIQSAKPTGDAAEATRIASTAPLPTVLNANDLEVDALLETPVVIRTKTYAQGSTIDWLHEDAAERARKQQIQSLRGLPRLTVPLREALQVLFIVIITGIGVGVTGAWLDVLVKWLSDIRLGRCAHGFMYNQVSCCSGLDPGENCTQWKTWSQWFQISSLAGQSFVQSFAYVIPAIAYAGSAAVLVQSYAPYAFHTGIPEIKAILNGYVLDAFLGPWTLLVKALGLALAVGSGLSLGKEGPMVHVSACMAMLIARLFSSFTQNQLRKRLIVSAAASAGVAVAFGSPLGGVLFGLEELDLFSNERLIWTAFVLSVISSMTLQYADPFGTGRLVLFQINAGKSWRGFELVPWLIIGAIGGVLGSLFIRLNIRVAVYRQRSILASWPLVEVVSVAGLTAILSFPIPFLKIQISELVALLFHDCDTTVVEDDFGLCNVAPTAVFSTIFLLLTTAALRLLLTGWTFGMKIPAGIFLPSLAIGASLGRAVGILVQAWHRAHPTAWMFSSCPTEGACVSPGFYAVVGAAAMLGGVTRMTISIVVILFELTGALSHVLPIMLAVMTSKVISDGLSTESIYTAWIALHDYPFLPMTQFRDQGETAKDCMIPLSEIVSVQGEGASLRELAARMDDFAYEGFPVVGHIGMLIGYVTRDALRQAITPLLASTDSGDLDKVLCSFVPQHPNTIDISPYLESTSMRLRQETPLQVVVGLFQSMNIPFVLFTSSGKLSGMMTRKDVIRLMNTQFEFTGEIPDAELEKLKLSGRA